MPLYTLSIYSAANFLNGSGQPAIRVNDNNGNLAGGPPFSSGTAAAQSITIDDQGGGGALGETFDFDDGTQSTQFLTTSVTLSYRESDGSVSTRTFPPGTQVQSEAILTMSNGDRIITLRFQDPPGSGNFFTAGYAVLTPGGGTQTPPPGTVFGSVTATSSDGTIPWPEVAPCFTPGTRIAVPGGEMAVEDIRAGQRVLTRDHGAMAVEWAGRMVVPAARAAADPRLRPVVFPAGTLGNRVPLALSPAHRVLLRHPTAALVAGHPECLAPAAALVGLGGVAQPAPAGDIVYHHLRLARHAILWADGAETESLWGGTCLAAELGGPVPALALRDEPLARPLARRAEARLIFAALLAGAAGDAAAVAPQRLSAAG
jgi:hypothetical protein